MVPRTTLLKRAVALLLSVLLTACGAATPIDDTTQIPATQVPRTPTPAATKTPAPTPTATPVPSTSTPTPIVLSATDREEVLQAFAIMAFAEMATKIMHRSATTALAEADTDPFRAGTRMLVGAMAAGLLKQATEKVTPPVTLKPFWDEILAASADMMEMVTQWTNQDIKISEIEARMPAIEERVSAAVDNAQLTLELLYAWDNKELETVRQDMLAREDSFFATATPKP